MARSESGESVIERTVRILDSFDPENRVLTVSELARRARLPLSTTSRLAEDLVAQGLLRRESDRRLGIGVRLWELAARASPVSGLREIAMPIMEDLHVAVGQHAQLAVLDDDEVLFIERLTAPGSVINLTRIAGRLPIHLSASGLVLLAHASPDVQAQVFNGPLSPMTSAGPRDEKSLRVEIAETRRRGYAFCPGYIDPLAAGLAAPLRDAHGHVVAALALVVPNDDQSRVHLSALMAAARGISRGLGSDEQLAQPR